MPNWKKQFITILISSALSGCAVGPQFHTPDAPNTQSYTGTALPKKTVSTSNAGNAGNAQYFVSGREIPAQWWTLFHSAELNQLITTGLANSPNLAAAKAALQAAHENTVAQIGSGFFPSITANLNGQREKPSSASFGSTSPINAFSLYNASVSVSYPLDVFGGERRQVEVVSAQEDAARYELDAAYLTLTANIVTTAITAASLQTQIQATQAIIQAQAGQLDIVRKQYHLGAAAESDVLTQETQLAQTRASLPPLEQRLAQNLHLLSVLMGSVPNETQLPKLSLNKIRLPTTLPVSLPSALVHQRPDILAAEANLHAACAEVGVATANLFPQLTLTGNYGWENTNISSLFNPTNLVWNYGGALMQPIFNAGSLTAKRRAAIDLFQQSSAQYRETVLQAFQNVADTLRALQHDAEALKLQKTAESAAYRALVLTEKRYKLGGVNYLELLTAQNQYQQTRMNYIQAQAARYTDTAALFQALGGDWWHQQHEIEG